MEKSKKLVEIFLILMLASSAGLLRNHIHTKGIPLKGHWDKSEGVVTAGSNNSDPAAGVLEEIRSPAEAKKLFDTGKYLFVDARGTEMFMEGRVKGAVSFPVNKFDALWQDFIKKYPVGTSMIIYCSGRECEDSHTLGGLLEGMGYSGIKIMIDGFLGWHEGGFPIESD